MDNPLDIYAGIHILSAENVYQSINEETYQVTSAFNVHLPRTFVGALCFQKMIAWGCNFFDDIKKTDYIQDTIEEIVFSFIDNPDCKCYLILVNSETIDKVVEIVQQTIAIHHANLTCHVQSKPVLLEMKDRIRRYKGSPLKARYGVYQFTFDYRVHIDDDNEFNDHQAYIIIESCDFIPVWSEVDSEVFLAALRHDIVQENIDKNYKDPPYYK